jgi:inhibitor of KinA sporulation pathway (predicted exonuclease)
VAKLFDKIVTIDLEATCWPKQPPQGQKSEIIEIGICTLDLKTLERGEKKSVLVKPVKSEISPFCTELTTITADMLKDAVSLKEALMVLATYKPDLRTWASYGDYDRTMLEKDCADKGLKNPMGKTHLNVKNFFCLKNKLDKEVGVDEALKMLKRPFEGTPHRGGDDSFNIAGILATLLK